MEWCQIASQPEFVLDCVGILKKRKNFTRLIINCDYCVTRWHHCTELDEYGIARLHNPLDEGSNLSWDKNDRFFKHSCFKRFQHQFHLPLISQPQVWQIVLVSVKWSDSLDQIFKKISKDSFDQIFKKISKDSLRPNFQENLLFFKSENRKTGVNKNSHNDKWLVFFPSQIIDSNHSTWQIYEFYNEKQ